MNIISIIVLGIIVVYAFLFNVHVICYGIL